MTGTARLIAEAAEAQRINRLFDRKYGVQKKGFDLMLSLRGGEWATISVELAEAG
jgi:hypothetical protein